ncbi:MAG: polymer-forming cytoskeletal protein [Candidatus Hydrogenedentota bacterium]
MGSSRNERGKSEPKRRSRSKDPRAEIAPLPEAGADTYEALAEATNKSSLLDRVNTAFHEALQNRRAGNRRPPSEIAPGERVTADDLAIRRARYVTPRKMTIPEGVIVDGSLSSPAETEIDGRVQGDVLVEASLSLGANALISGKIQAANCEVKGLVEGKVECSGDLVLGQGGRLKADVLAGKSFTAAGQVDGEVLCGGLLHVCSTAQITGDIRAKQIVIEEGAQVNGRCSMSSQPQKGARREKAIDSKPSEEQ